MYENAIPRMGFRIPSRTYFYFRCKVTHLSLDISFARIFHLLKNAGRWWWWCGVFFTKFAGKKSATHLQSPSIFEYYISIYTLVLSTYTGAETSLIKEIKSFGSYVINRKSQLTHAYHRLFLALLHGKLQENVKILK